MRIIFQTRNYHLSWTFKDSGLTTSLNNKQPRPGTSLLEEDAGKSCNRESVSRLLHKSFTLGSVDLDLVSEMRGESEIILADDRRALARHLPPRTDGHSWELYYGTGRDGYSLHHLYNRLQGCISIDIYDLGGV